MLYKVRVSCLRNGMCRVSCSGERAAVMLSAGALSRAGFFFSVSHHYDSQVAGSRALRPGGLTVWFNPTRRRLVMNTKSKIVLAAVAGAALGATAIQGLHAQAKLKAYSVGEVELIGTLPPDYLPAVRKAIEAAPGHASPPLKGRVES